MPFELVHFRESEQVIKKRKGMMKEVMTTLQYIDDVLYGSLCRGSLFRQALEDLGWRESGALSILEGRRYQYKGIKNRIAIEGSFSAYEYILEGLVRLQIGFDKGRLDAGILILTGLRGERTPYGSTVELVESEIEQLYPTISLPVCVVLFDVGSPFVDEEIPQIDSSTETPE